MIGNIRFFNDGMVDNCMIFANMMLLAKKILIAYVLFLIFFSIVGIF